MVNKIKKSFFVRDHMGPFLGVYFGLSLINLASKLKLTSAWFNGKLVGNHQKLLDFQYTNNEQSRLLQFYIPEFFHNFFGMELINAYILQRWLFVFLAFSLFHRFLRQWFTHTECFVSVCLLAAIMPFTYMNYLQESAPLLMLTFLVALWAISKEDKYIFSGTLFLGTLNNETILSLSAYWFLFRCHKWELRVVLNKALEALMVSLPAIIALFSVRYYTRDNPHLGNPLQLWSNLKGIFQHLQNYPIDWWRSYYLNIFIIFGFMWVLALYKQNKIPRFFKCGIYFLPLFILPHFVTGIIYEVRQMIPIAYLIIPLTVMKLVKITEGKSYE